MFRPKPLLLSAIAVTAPHSAIAQSWQQWHKQNPTYINRPARATPPINQVKRCSGKVSFKRVDFDELQGSYSHTTTGPKSRPVNKKRVSPNEFRGSYKYSTSRSSANPGIKNRVNFDELRGSSHTTTSRSTPNYSSAQPVYKKAFKPLFRLANNTNCPVKNLSISYMVYQNRDLAYQGEIQDRIVFQPGEIEIFEGAKFDSVGAYRPRIGDLDIQWEH